MEAHTSLAQPRSPARILRIALLGNAGFSTLSGLVLTLSPERVGGWLGWVQEICLQAIGVGLLGFAMVLGLVACRPKPRGWQALLLSLADFGWVLLSVAAVIAFPSAFSTEGTWLVLGVATVVACFGTLQIRGVDRLYRLPGTRLHRHCLAVEVEASAEQMWSAIADLGGIHRYAPQLRSASVSERPVGKGSVRTCVNQGGQRWSERCVVFEPGSRLELEFLSDDPSFPFPARCMTGGWQVKDKGVHCTVEIWWELQVKPAVLAPWIMSFLAWQVDGSFVETVGRMALGKDSSVERRAIRARLLPRFC